MSENKSLGFWLDEMAKKKKKIRRRKADGYAIQLPIIR
jgi:hypothetical protein